MSETKKYIRLFTTAPIDYDYGCTFPGIKAGTFDQGGKGITPVREVFVLEEKANYQIGRYSSGLYGTWTEAQAREEMKYPYLKLEE